MKIAIFAAHPDDELIGCGGTILKALSEGHEVELVFATSGDLSERKIREREVKEIYGKLNINYHFLRLKDRFFEYSQDSLNKIIRLLRIIKPDILYYPHDNEEDRDHRELNKIMNEAWWISNDTFMPELGGPCSIKKILKYEVWTPILRPNYLERIDEFVKKKTELLREYKSQISHQRYDLASEGLNSYRGVMGTGEGFAEAFILKIISEELL